MYVYIYIYIHIYIYTYIQISGAQNQTGLTDRSNHSPSRPPTRPRDLRSVFIICILSKTKQEST